LSHQIKGRHTAAGPFRTMRPCSCSSTSTAWSIAAPTQCRVSQPSSLDRVQRGDEVVYVTNNSMF
jgi:hypothetical protein